MEIVAAALHLGETHGADSTGRPARGGTGKIPLGAEQSSLIFPGEKEPREISPSQARALFVASALAVALYVGGVAGRKPQPVHYTVAPGDTLWGIAIEHTAVWEDPRPKVEAIRGRTTSRGMRSTQA